MFFAENFLSTTATMVSTMNSNMVTAGWTSSGSYPNYTWTNPSGTRDRTISFTLAGVAGSYLNFAMQPNSAGSGTLSNNILLTNATSTSAGYRLTMSVGVNHALIVLEGPRGGENYAYDATYGSERQYFFMGSVTPYFSSDNVLDQLVVGGASNAVNQYSRLSNPTLKIMRSASGAYWTDVELLAMRTMTYGTAAGDFPEFTSTALSSGHFLSPIVVMERDSGGIRGSLRELAYYAEGDSKISENHALVAPELLVNAVAHDRIRLAHPSSADLNWYHPFGRGQGQALQSSNANCGSPILYVRRT